MPASPPPERPDVRFRVVRWLRRNGFTLAVTFILAAFVWYLQVQTWPHVGHDYQYFLPRLLDVQLHYLCDGAGIQWWTPSFGGGLPAFANPQHTQFMPAQWLVFFLDPWRAVVTANVMLTALGFLLVERFARIHLHCSPAASIFAGTLFATSGFGLHHMLVGHVAFATWPLVAVLPAGFVAATSWSRRVLMLGITAAAIIYAGGYVIVVIWALSVPILATVLWGIDRNRFPWWPAIAAFCASALVAAMLALVKVVAIAEFLEQYPHQITDPAPEGLWSALAHIGSQLTAWRLGAALHFVRSQFDPYLYIHDSLWEHDVGVSPVALVPLFALGIVGIGRWKPDYRTGRTLIVLLTGVGVFTAIVSGHPLITAIMHQVPLLRSLHANTRLTSTLVLPIALGAGVALTRLTAKLSPARSSAIGWSLVAASLLTLAPFVYLRYQRLYTSFDGRTIELAWNASRHGERFVPVQTLALLRDDEVFAARASTLTPYEPIFGYGFPGDEFRTQLLPGPIWTRSAAPPNFHYPPQFLIDRRIAFGTAPMTEAPQIVKLLERRQPAWQLSRRVRFSAWASGLSAVAVLVAFFGLDRAVSRWVRNNSAGLRARSSG